MAGCIFALTFWLFWPATQYDFINFDDDRYVYNNEMVQRGLTDMGIRWACHAIYESYWLPLLWMSYMADTSLFGREPFGYHLTNISLHALNAAILFLLLWGWTRRFWSATFVAMLFAWHPLRVESVVWITERKDVLSGLFFLLSLACYRRYTRNPVSPRDVPTAVLMALGLMVKPILITLPFIFLLLDFWPFRRISANRQSIKQLWRPLIAEKALFWLLAIVFSAITYFTQNTSGAILHTAPKSIIDHIARVPLAYMFYLKKTFWPFDLQVIYGELSQSVPLVLLALVILGTITGVALLLARRLRPLSVGWFWYLGILVPVIGFIRVGTVHVADRFTYLPSIGLAIALTWGVVAALPRREWRTFFLLAAAMVSLTACMILTRSQMPMWQNASVLFQDVLRRMPDNFIANNNYGTSLVSKGRTEEALPYFKKASSANPRFTMTAANIGRALTLLNRIPEAIVCLQESLEQLNPNCPHLNYALGQAYLEDNKAAEAIPYLRKACDINPYENGWRADLIRAFLENGDDHNALLEMNVLEQNGGLEISEYSGLSRYYLSAWKHGEKNRAINFFTRAVAKHPENVMLLNNAAWVLARDINNPVSASNALVMAQRAFELGKQSDANVADTLAETQAAAGNYTQAVELAQTAVKLARRGNLDALAEKIERKIPYYRRHQFPPDHEE